MPANEGHWRTFEDYTKDAWVGDNPVLYRLNRLVAAGFEPEFDATTPDCVWLRFRDDEAGIGSGILGAGRLMRTSLS
jgi:hypothetical protein